MIPFAFRWPITSEETVLFAKRVPWFHSNDSVPEIAVQRGAFAATIKVATSEIFGRPPLAPKEETCFILSGPAHIVAVTVNVLFV